MEKPCARKYDLASLKSSRYTTGDEPSGPVPSCGRPRAPITFGGSKGNRNTPAGSDRMSCSPPALANASTNVILSAVNGTWELVPVAPNTVKDCGNRTNVSTSPGCAYTFSAGWETSVSIGIVAVTPSRDRRTKVSYTGARAPPAA